MGNETQCVITIKNSTKLVYVDKEDYEMLAQNSWRVFPNGYVARSATKAEFESGLPKTIYMHRKVMGYPKGMQIDHINTDKLDNRKENLRVVTNEQNHKNRPKRSKTSSKYKGVYRTPNGKWIASIVVDGTHKFLGRYEDEEKAAKAYDEAALIHFGEYARTNKIQGLIS